MSEKPFQCGYRTVAFARITAFCGWPFSIIPFRKMRESG
jgi:hypothetical protein